MTRFCRMGDVEIRVCRDAQGNRVTAWACPHLQKCAAERRAFSDRYNPLMSNEEICRTWPGAHLGSVAGGAPRWILQQHRKRGCCEPYTERGQRQ